MKSGENFLNTVLDQERGARVRAPAKVNLNLHIEGRRPDGYHVLSGLVAFANIADQLHIRFTPPSQVGGGNSNWSLDISGPFAGCLNDASSKAEENLVVKAARLFGEQLHVPTGGSISLQKNLPVSAGIGGGSADAAATLNALQKVCTSPLEESQLRDLAVRLGADVPMCLTPTAQMISGIGEVCQSVDDFAPLPALLVNPGVGVSTAAIFRDLGALELPVEHVCQQPRIPNLSTLAKTLEYVQAHRNDLEEPALRNAPIIAEVLKAIDADECCHLARMSGSGATCFGLYESVEAAGEAAQKISKDHPGWWVVATVLR